MTEINHNSTLGLPSPIPEVSQTFLSKEEITKYTDINPYTLRNWIADLEPAENEVETGKRGVKRYSLDYIKRLFEENKQSELFNSLVEKMSTKDEPVINQRLTNSEVEYLRQEIEKRDKTIKDKDELIVNLIKEQRQDFTAVFQMMSQTSNDIKELFRNSQILLAQEKKPLLNQSGQKIIDSDDIGYYEDDKVYQNPNNKSRNKKGFFGRLFS